MDGQTHESVSERDVADLKSFKVPWRAFLMTV